MKKSIYFFIIVDTLICELKSQSEYDCIITMSVFRCATLLNNNLLTSESNLLPD
jgi:hypothetical protein